MISTYRVAIVQNEREMLRAGYVNFAPKLSRNVALQNYDLSVFDAANIDELFSGGQNSLANFDSVFISTNATSDSRVLAKLKLEKESIVNFLALGRGIFVGSQKKLSANVLDLIGVVGETGFLPERYEFKTVERPRSERDSGEGSIELSPDTLSDWAGTSIVSYPHRVTASEVLQRCHQNDFKRHVYRSHMAPRNAGTYIQLLADSSYGDARGLLMVNSVSLHEERVVASTVVLDWGFHEHLLINIIRYITEGRPLIAFLEKPGSGNSDYQYITSSVKLAKLPHVVYGSIESISVELRRTHNTYVFSPGWTEDEILAFWLHIRDPAPRDNQSRRSFRRIYFLREAAGQLGLTRYSNFSSIDLLVDNASLWIESQFRQGMWAGSFWTTYDVLSMMIDLQMNVASYLTAVFRDIRTHSADGSYDGVMSTTCGLLELMLRIKGAYANQLGALGIDRAQLERTFSWIVANFASQSLYEAQTATIALTHIARHAADPMWNASLDQMRHAFSSRLGELPEETELDICRKIAVKLQFSGIQKEIAGLVRALRARQATGGRFSSEKRTAFVLVFLMRDVLPFVGPALRPQLDEIIYVGVLFLRSCCKPMDGYWDDDIQTTANAIHAIGLYGRIYGHSTQDFFESIGLESKNIGSNTAAQSASAAMDRMREQLDSDTRQLKELHDRLENAQAELRASSQRLSEASAFEEKANSYAETAKYVATISASVLIGVIFSLWLYHQEVIEALAKELGSVLAMLVSTAVGIAVGLMTRRPGRSQ